MNAQTDAPLGVKTPKAPNAIPSAIARLDRTISDTTERLMALEALLAPILLHPAATPIENIKRELDMTPLAEVIHVIANSAGENFQKIEDLISRIQL